MHMHLLRWVFGIVRLHTLATCHQESRKSLRMQSVLESSWYCESDSERLYLKELSTCVTWLRNHVWGDMDPKRSTLRVNHLKGTTMYRYIGFLLHFLCTYRKSRHLLTIVLKQYRTMHIITVLIDLYWAVILLFYRKRREIKSHWVRVRPSSITIVQHCKSRPSKGYVNDERMTAVGHGVLLLKLWNIRIVNIQGNILWMIVKKHSNNFKWVLMKFSCHNLRIKKKCIIIFNNFSFHVQRCCTTTKIKIFVIKIIWRHFTNKLENTRLAQDKPTFRK